MTATFPDGRKEALEAEAAFLSRSRYYAGPFVLAPGAALNADALGLTVMPRAGRRHAVAFALVHLVGLDAAKLGLARHHAVRAVHFDNCTHPVQVDGDAVGPCANEVTLTGATARFCIAPVG